MEFSNKNLIFGRAWNRRFVQLDLDYNIDSDYNQVTDTYILLNSNKVIELSPEFTVKKTIVLAGDER